MKVYITGSHSVGKSTLARYISEKYSLPLLPEVSRIILAEKELQIDSLRSNIDVVNSFQRDIFYRQIEQEKKCENFVSDRAFDCLAYTAQHSTILSELMNTEEYKKYIQKFIDGEDMKIFFIRPSKATLKNDGIRETISWDGIIAIDAICKFLIEMNGIKTHQISTDSMQERCRNIDAILGG